MRSSSADRPAPTEATSRAQIVGLDILRFFAAALVVVFHLCFWGGIDGQITSRAAGGTYFLPGSVAAHAGWIGVQIFFVLSGIVIAYSASGRSTERFVRSRVARLVPGLWLCATLTLAIGLSGPAFVGERPLALAVRSFVLWPLGGWVDAVYWTLTVEVAFYALIAVSIATGWFRDPRWIAYALAALSLAFWIVLATSGQIGLHDGVANSRPAALLLLRHGCFFALGMLLWLWLLKGDRHGLSVIFGAVALAGCAFEITSVGRIYAVRTGLSAAPLLPLAIWGGAVLTMVASIRYNDGIARALSPWSRMIRRLGLMTYPLYLIHNVAGATVIGHVRAAGGGVVGAVVAGILVSVVLAFAVTLAEPVVARPLLAAFDALAARWNRHRPRRGRARGSGAG